MMTLTATKRTETEKASRALIGQGMMPAVVYGPDHAAEAITVQLSDFTKILRDEGESTVVEIAGLGSTFQVLIKDLDLNPVTGTPRHADLYAIKKGAKVTVAVPISFINESPAAKAGASLVMVMREIEVESDPAKLPHEIEVDLEALTEVGSQIHLKDIKLPAGVVATADGDEVVALAQETKEEPEETTDAPDMDAIDVEQKGKSDEEGGESEGAE